MLGESATGRSRGALLRRAALRGSLWALVGYAGIQALRIPSHLILTRLLVPEVFGLMALLTACLQGLQLLSDFGIGLSIVQNERGEEQDFLDTAWTLQIVRAVVLWLGACALAPFLAVFYEQPVVAELLPVAALSILIQGLHSTSLSLASRRLALGRLTAVEFVGQAASAVTMIGWAWYAPTVWALVAGVLVSSAVKLVLTHVGFGFARNRLRWDRSAVRGIARFGGWVFVSTALMFVWNQVDKLVLAKAVDPERLGVYAIALVLPTAIVQLTSQVAQLVLFPFYSRLHEEGPGPLRREMLRARLVLAGLVAPVLWLLAFFGQEVVAVLYDANYQEAGWMLQVLALGEVGTLITVTSGGVLLAVGDSFRQMLLQLGRTAIFVAGVVIGLEVAGLAGVVVGVSIARLVDYPVLVLLIRRYGVWFPVLDAVLIGGTVIVGIISMPGWWNGFVP